MVNISSRTAYQILAVIIATCLIFAFATNVQSKEKGKDDGNKVYDPEIGLTLQGKAEGKKKTAKQKKQEKKLRNSNAKKVKHHIEGLQDISPDVRKTAAEMLGYIGAPEAVPPLIDALTDRQITVRLAANASLIRLTRKNFGHKRPDLWAKWWRSNKDDFVEKHYNKPTETARIRAEAQNTVGMELLRLKQWRGAHQKFLDAISFDPEVPDYRNNLGRALMGEGRYLDAMEYFQETIGLNPELPQPYFNIGHCYQLLGRDIEAQFWYQKSIKIDKKGMLSEHLHLLGHNLLGQGEFNLAVEYLEQARIRAERKRQARNPHLYKDLALAYYGLHRLQDAWRELRYIQALGYEPSESFLAKVKEGLIKRGDDPDKLAAPDRGNVPVMDEPAPVSSDIYLPPVNKK